MKEIFKICLALEIGIADLIFRRITKKNIEELREIVSNEPLVTRYHLL